MNKTFFLYAAIYKTRCCFSNLKKFTNLIEPFLTEKEATLKGTVLALENAKEHFEKSFSSKLIDSNKIAQGFLLCQDLDRLKKALMCQDPNQLKIEADSISELIDFYIKELNLLGANLDRPYFEIVDKFPPPFDQAATSAFCPDAEDEKRYGIKRGIYLRKDSIRPFYTQALIAHEIIHCICGKTNPEILAMGLEEGIAEIIGSLYLASKKIGSEIAKNVFIYSRQGQPISKIWALYLDHTRQASFLYRKNGLDGLISLINKGRKQIHSVEACLLKGDIEGLNFNSKNYYQDLENMVEFVLNIYPNNFVLTPLQRYILNYIEENRSIKEICESARVPENTGIEILNQLSNETLLFLIDENERIAFSNAKFYLDIENKTNPVGFLRYNLE